jgi:hypothetical protein
MQRLMNLAWRPLDPLVAAEPAGATSPWVWALLVGVLVVAWVVGFDWLRRVWSERAGTGRTLFVRLARAHRLSTTERRWLAAAARHVCPQQPERVFVEPAILEGLVGTRSDLGGHYTRLRARLFGEQFGTTRK